MQVFLKALRYAIVDQIFDVLYFSLWWYSKGLKKFLLFIREKIKYLTDVLALKVLFSYLFQPMYGQYDRMGRIISFFMRCVHLLIHLILFILGLIGLLILLVFWVGLPIFSIYQIVSLSF